MRASLSQNVAIMWLIVVACCHAQSLRDLAVGDFEELNDLLSGATIKLPDTRVESNSITLDMTNLRCTKFRVDDILLNSGQSTSGGAVAWGPTRLSLNIEGLDMQCFLDYKYSFIFTRYGRADLYSYDNRASVSMLFEEPSYSQGTFHPTKSSIEQCFPEVNVADLDFHGDIAAVVLNAVDRLLRDQVEAQAEKRICEELQSLSRTLVTDMLQGLDKRLNEFITAPPSDPLKSENELIVPDSISIVDFQKKESWKKWLDQMLVDAMAFLTKPVEDDAYGSDMNINVLIRDNFLDDDGAFLLDIGGAFVLYDGHDRFLRSTILLDSVKVLGLDTLTSFAPLVDVGKHTLQNEFSFRYLTVEMDIIMNLKPSTLPDSIFVNPDGSVVPPGTDGILEKVTVKFSVKDLKAAASILLAVDEAKLGSVSLGSLLDTENILSCFLSTLFAVQISDLAVDVSDMQPPTLEGFVSPGIDRLVTGSVDAAFLMYKATMLQAAPGFFQTVATDLLNKRFLQDYPVGAGVADQCSPPVFSVTEGSYVDFRDLLLTPDEAKGAGGLGTQPYGDVVYTIVSELREQLLANDIDGSPKVNSLIRDLLAKSSNANGSLAVYTDDMLNTTSSIGMGGFQADLGFRIFDARLDNLDTFGPPIQFLEPVSGQAHLLNNSVSIGVDSRPVRLSAKVLITLSDGADLQLRNEVGVSLDLSSASIGLVLLLQILEQPFFAVPLRDTLNLNCWLTTILPPSGTSPGLELKEHSMSVQDLSLDISCVSCSSPNFDDLIDSLYSEETKTKVYNFIDLLLDSDYVDIASRGLLTTASKQCPHTADYDENSSWGDFIKDIFGASEVVGATRDEKAKYFNVALAAITVGLIVVFLVVRWIAKRKNHAMMDSLPSEAIFRLRLLEEDDKDKEIELNDTTESMFRSPQLPRHIRLLVPFVIVVTIGLVLVGHLGVLSSVNVVGQFAGESFAVSNILEFSFFSAAIRTYNNGGVEVAILLFLFTAVWLVKLITSLALWFIPPRKLSVKKRGTILLWLDVFAKLSLPDIFMMLLAVGAILVFSGGIDGSLEMDGDFFSAKLIIVPGAGFYCIIMGQRITRVTSRYLLDCHDEIVKAATRELKQSEEWLMRVSDRTNETWPIEDDDEESNISELGPSSIERDEVPPRNDTDSRSCTSSSETSDCAEDSKPVGKSEGASRSITHPAAVAFIAITVVILIIIACVFVPAISIDTRVVWGLLGTGKTFEEVVNEYGMFWLISRILVQSRFVLDSVEDYVGLGFLLALVIFTSLISPMTKAIAVLRRWRQQRRTRPRPAQPKSRQNKQANGTSVPLRTRIMSSLQGWVKGGNSVEEDSHLMPACKLKAWEDLEVYIVAFVVACWQLGAVAGYAIHIYCFILEKVYDIVVYLGLMEKTTPQCYRVQTSSPIFVLIVFLSFFLLLASFLLQAASQYRKSVAETARELKGVDSVGEKEEDQGPTRTPSVMKSKAVEANAIADDSTPADETETTTGSF